MLYDKKLSSLKDKILRGATVETDSIKNEEVVEPLKKVKGKKYGKKN